MLFHSTVNCCTWTNFISIEIISTSSKSIFLWGFSWILHACKMDEPFFLLAHYMCVCIKWSLNEWLCVFGAWTPIQQNDSFFLLSIKVTLISIYLSHFCLCARWAIRLLARFSSRSGSSIQNVTFNLKCQFSLGTTYTIMYCTVCFVLCLSI